MFSDAFIKRREELREQQRQRDEARKAEQPLQPSGLSYEQSRRNRLAREETARDISASVEKLSDREPVCPIQARRDELAAKMKHAGYSEKAAIRERLKVLDSRLSEIAAEKAEAKRQEDYRNHPQTILVSKAVAALRNAELIFKDCKPEEVERLREIGTRHDLFVDPEHGSRMFWEEYSRLTEKQIQADEARHAEQAALASHRQAELDAATARVNEGKARLEATKQQLGGDDVQPPTE